MEVDRIIEQILPTGRIKNHTMCKGLLMGICSDGTIADKYDAENNTLYLSIKPMINPNGKVISANEIATKAKQTLQMANYDIGVKWREK